MEVRWTGACVEECHYWNASVGKKAIAAVDLRYFRATEVETLPGGPSKAELGWRPKTTFEELLKNMVREDLKFTECDELIMRHGYKAIVHYE